jgi:SAM-dependent methyltransferase
MKNKNELRVLSEKINSLPNWDRWNNYKDIYDTSKITESFLESILFQSEEESVLDFGAGFALNSFYAKKSGLKIDALDIDTEEVRKTFKEVHKILDLETDLYDGINVPYEDESYDKIIFKASITKFISTNTLDIFDELVRISKPGATWYIAPPYMYPRFIAAVTKAAGKALLSNLSVDSTINSVYGEVLKKNISIVVWDWTKRSTFAIWTRDDIVSDIGWTPTAAFERESLTTCFKYDIPSATSFVPVHGVHLLYRDLFDAIMSLAPALGVEQEKANQLGHAFKVFVKENLDKINETPEVANTKKLSIIPNGQCGLSVKDNKTYIVARGASASQIPNLELVAAPDECVIYVNDWKEELTTYDFSRFSEKSLNIHFLNRGISLNKLKTRQYFDKKFNLLQLNCEFSEQDHAAISELYKEAADNSINLAWLPHDIITTPVKTAGLHAVFYAVKILKRKEIEIFGLDFFECNYMTKHVVTGKPEPREYQPAKGKIAKGQFLDLVKSNPGVKFTINTFAKFDEKELKNIKNLTVNHLK